MFATTLYIVTLCFVSSCICATVPLSSTFTTNEPPDLATKKIKVQASLLELQTVADDKQEFGAQIIVQSRWADNRIRDNPSNLSALPWSPTVFAMNSFSLVSDPVLIFDGTEVQTTAVYHFVSKFAFDPLAYPFDSHDLPANIYFGLPVSRVNRTLGAEHSSATQAAKEDSLKHSTEQGWEIRTITGRDFVYCFPFHTRDKPIYEISKVFLDEAETEGKDAATLLLERLADDSVCLTEPMAGHQITININRKSSGFFVRLIAPIAMITLLSTAQVWMDLKFIGSRNQIVTLSMLTSFNLIGGTRLPHTNSVSWFELFGFVGVTVFMLIVFINVIAHNIERKGRPLYSRVFDKIARAMLPWHFFVGVLVISLIAFTSMHPVLGVMLYAALIGAAAGGAFVWHRRVVGNEHLLAEKIIADQQKVTRKEEEKTIITKAVRETWGTSTSKKDLTDEIERMRTPAPPVRDPSTLKKPFKVIGEFTNDVWRKCTRNSTEGEPYEKKLENQIKDIEEKSYDKVTTRNQKHAGKKEADALSNDGNNPAFVFAACEDNSSDEEDY